MSNNTLVPLLADASFTGLWQKTLDFAVITVNLNTSSLALLTIQQSQNGSTIDNTTSISYQPGAAVIVQETIGLQFFRVILQNVDIVRQSFLRLISSLSLNRSVDVDIRTLSAFANFDNVAVVGKDADGVQHYLLTDASGALIVNFI